MDDFGFEAHHARVAAAMATAGDTPVEGVEEGQRGEPEGAEAATTPDRQQPVPASSDEASRRPAVDAAAPARRSNAMPRSKGAQASAQNTPPRDDTSEDGRLADTEEAVPLPQAFSAQYLGSRPASGLWGVRHTRKPVDEMVAAARASPAPLPWTRLRVSASGVAVFHGGDAAGATGSDGAAGAATGGRRTGAHGHAAVAVRALRSHDIAAISYGVQDLVYTRVFCFIVVTDHSGHVSAGVGPGAAPVFQCHAYVCESRMAARALTHALAAAFRAFSRELRRAGPNARALAKNRFKIDLRSPEQLAAHLADTSDA